MSANLDRLKGVYEAFAKGDVQAVLGAMHDRIEWREPAWRSAPAHAMCCPESSPTPCC
jgi:hypothetical protein